MSSASSFQSQRSGFIDRHLRVLTNSELREARACLRRHYYKYRIKRRPRKNAEALTFGTLWHVGQQAWWTCDGEPVDRFDCAVDAMRLHYAKSIVGDNEISPFALVTVEELTLGYTARWGDAEYQTVAVEKSFEVPLINPETGAPSRTFLLGGKFDGIVRDDLGLHVLEHKSTGGDLEVGSLFWEKVRSLDTQVSTYMAGAKATGFDVLDCIFDVVRKPGIKPLKATPEESRQYKKEKSKQCPFCKKKGNVPGPHLVSAEGEPKAFCEDGRIITERGGELYANQRLDDETTEEFRIRLREDISARPDRYYARGTVVRLEDDERDHAFDTWQAAKILHESERANRAPKNPDSCASFGGCPYLRVCTREANIDDERLFRTSETAHEELAQEVG